MTPDCQHVSGQGFSHRGEAGVVPVGASAGQSLSQTVRESAGQLQDPGMRGGLGDRQRQRH